MQEEKKKGLEEIRYLNPSSKIHLLTWLHAATSRPNTAPPLPSTFLLPNPSPTKFLRLFWSLQAWRTVVITKAGKQWAFICDPSHCQDTEGIGPPHPQTPEQAACTTKPVPQGLLKMAYSTINIIYRCCSSGDLSYRNNKLLCSSEKILLKPTLRQPLQLAFVFRSRCDFRADNLAEVTAAPTWKASDDQNCKAFHGLRFHFVYFCILLLN